MTNIHASTNSLNASGSFRPHMETESILELQKIVADERKRATEHKLNYQQIKQELNKMQENYTRLDYDYAASCEARKNENDEAQRKINQLNRRLMDVLSEIEDLKANQVTEKRIEIIRSKIEEQFEVVYQERLSRCSTECDSMRTEMGRLRTENTFLKAEYEHQHKEHSRIIDEMKLIHQSEVSGLRNEKNRLLANSIEIPQESGNVKELSKANSVLRSQLKAMLNELQESRKNLEHERNNSEQELRAKKTQVTELSSSCRKMELELETLRTQLVNSQKELSSWNIDHANLQFNYNELDRTNRMLQNRLDELTQKAKVDLTQLKLESTKQKGDIERQKDLLAARIEELEYQLRLTGTKCVQLETQLQEREVSIARREASMKEAEWARMQQLENEKLELESQLSNLQSVLREERNSVSGKMASLEDRTQKAEQAERTSDKERDTAKHKLESSVAEIKNLKNTVNELRIKAVQQEAELDECYNRLAAYELAKKDRNDSQFQVQELTKKLSDIMAQQENALQDKDSQCVQDRERHQQRIKELEKELAKSLEKTMFSQDELRRKNKKHSEYFNKQKRKLQIATALKEELQAENEILKRNVPAEDVQKLTKELKDLRRRHQEYRAIIMQAGTRVPGGAEMDSQESRYEQSLEQLKRRLELLDEKQQHQLHDVVQLQQSEKVDLPKTDSLFGPRGDNF